MRELISVIMPVYNAENYLNECIDSVLNQTYKNIELILIDDGSTDRSAYICDNYAKGDSRIKVIHKKNEGLSMARNLGIINSTSKYIFFVDSDDYLHDKDTLKNMYELMIDGVDIVTAYAFERREDAEIYCDIDFKSKYIKISPPQAIDLMYDWRISKYNFIFAQNKLYRKNLFDNIGFPIGKTHEDEFTTYKLYLKSRSIIVLNKHTYAYRIRQGSIINSDYNLKRLHILEALEERMKILKKLGYNDLYIKTKKRYFYMLMYHRNMLFKNHFYEYKIINKKYINFMLENPKFLLSPLRYKFFIDKIKTIINSF